MLSTKDIDLLLKEEQHIRNGLKVIDLAEKTQPSSITSFYANEKLRLEKRLSQIPVEIYLAQHGEDIHTGQAPLESREPFDG
ncbi:hypothetical protein [Rhizobium etli]|uniref:hypothetical protein n=1 Tax=Rhizobium etli TaxID=29449 RepID=UPI000383A0B0|nr:hypothetical protein [Rhizobium etli]AGS23881.1 hypothetical protein REMIM1_CH04172 [Rhizobium etli bv. mimosae str. Mim1]